MSTGAEGIGQAIAAIFKYLTFSQNPDVVARKIKQKEWRKKDKILDMVVKARHNQISYEAIDPQTSIEIKKRKIFKAKAEDYWAWIDKNIGLR